MGAESSCCLIAFDDAKRERHVTGTLQEILQVNANHSTDSSDGESKGDLEKPITIQYKDVPPWDINSKYHCKLSYMEMSARYRYRKPPDFYDDCIRKLRSKKKRFQFTESLSHYDATIKQSQYDSIIQNIAKSLLRTRTMLTASFEEQQQVSGTTLIHEITEDDEKFWFQPFLYNVIDSIVNSVIKLIDSQQGLVLDYTDLYHILRSLPVLCDVLSPNYPYHYHDPSHDRLQYLFHKEDIYDIQTKADIISLISRANKSERTICAVGYASSWATNHWNNTTATPPLIAAMIPHHLRKHTTDSKVEYTEDLSRASITDYPLMFVEDIGNNKIRIGAATPIWLYREWCHTRIEANKGIPSEPNSAMSLYHSFIGLISVAEHGGGITSSTLADYVTQIKVINSEGIENEYRIDDDEKELKALLPHLGLLGIVTEIELQFESEYYCNLNVKVISIDKLFPKSKTKKTAKGRTFSKVFEDTINSTLCHEFMWYPTTNQIYYISLTHCTDDAPSQFFPSQTWQKNWIMLQSEINILNEIICIQLLNGMSWTAKLATKLVTKLSVNILKDLVIKLNIGPKMRTSSSTSVRYPKNMKLPSCDALHLFEFYPSQSNSNLSQSVSWLFPLDSKNDKKIMINDRIMANVELAAHLFMSAINCYNQNMMKRKYYPYQNALRVKVIKGSECALSHCNGADFYCEVTMSVYDIENNEIFKKFQKEFMETCRTKVYETNINGIKPHWRNAQIFKFFDVELQTQNGYNIDHNDNHNDIYAFIKRQYKERIDKLNEIRQRDNENPNVFEPQHLRKIFH